MYSLKLFIVLYTHYQGFVLIMYGSLFCTVYSTTVQCLIIKFRETLLCFRKLLIKMAVGGGPLFGATNTRPASKVLQLKQQGCIKFPIPLSFLIGLFQQAPSPPPNVTQTLSYMYMLSTKGGSGSERTKKTRIIIFFKK